MSLKTKTTRKSRRSVAKRTASENGRAQTLSFSDLEVPVEPLLTREQEIYSSRRVCVLLKRLSAMLPFHPRGYRRFLARMNEVVSGGAVVFSWFPRKEHIEGDLALATQSLERAETAFAKSSVRAFKRYREGVEVLQQYRLDPETLYQWSREIVAQQAQGEEFDRHPKARQLDRVLRRSLARLDKERGQLLRGNYRLVLKEVFRYRPIGMSYSDLFQEGILGLQKAVFRFDPERSIRFSTYATYWIRQSIRKALIDKSRMIRVPQAIQEELRKTGSPLNENSKEASRIRRIMGETIMFSYGESDDSKDRFAFDIKDPTTPELGEKLHTNTVPRVVHSALDTLSGRERDVLLRRYGLGGERPHTLEEIGVRMNLSRERIRQIEQEALRRMQGSRDLWEVYEDLELAKTTTASAHN
jgi:RNA polymerase primary sigma factor